MRMDMIQHRVHRPVTMFRYGKNEVRLLVPVAKNMV